MRAIRALVIVVALSAAIGCITEDVERAWQQNMAEALVPGYSNFRGLDVSTDIAWYLFSYQLPGSYDPAAAVPQLKLQIQRSRGVPPNSGKGIPTPCFKVVLETPTELQLRCDIVTYGEPGYDEWRILVDHTRRKVTAMYGNLDSEAERDAYPALLSSLRNAHARVD